MHFFKLIFSAVLAVAAITVMAKPAEPRICVLGSCSGTEPMPNRHHTAWTLEIDGRVYLFDAGENAGYTAHINGIDLTRLHAIFISHPHLDHNAGLPHVFTVRNKLKARYKKPLAKHPLPIFTPLPKQVNAAIELFSPFKGNNGMFDVKEVAAGIIFDDGTVKVEALPNFHIRPGADKKHYSYSYRIYAAGKKIVFSGDYRHLNHLGKLLDDCDVLLIETGHHKPWLTAETIRKTPAWNVRRLIFVHHGRDYLNNPAETARKTLKTWGKTPEFANDGMFIGL